MQICIVKRQSIMYTLSLVMEEGSLTVFILSGMAKAIGMFFKVVWRDNFMW